MKYLILFLLSNLICFSVSAQVFFKQRVYGNEEREKNVSSTVEVDNTTKMGTKELDGIEYDLYSDYTSEWKNTPIDFHRRKATFYIKNGNKAISLLAGRKLMKDMGEQKVVQAIDKSILGTGVGRAVQGISWFVGGVGVIFTLGSGSETGLVPVFVGAAGWYGGRQLVILSRTPIKNRLAEYNTRFENTENKNFYQNIKPSSLTFKPVQITPLTPSLAPTIGFSWKL